MNKPQYEDSFHADLKRGISVESKFIEIIKRKYPSTTLVNKFKGYDVWVPEIHKSFEIKYDPMSNKTGNVVVEIEMYGKPSALMATTADYWVFYDDQSFVAMKPMDIIRCIFDNKLQYVEFVGNGDRVSKKAFLIPKSKLFKYGKPFGESQ